MTDLTGQRRLAAQILKIGQNRVWINPERMDDVEGAITREEVRKLIHEKIIVSLPEKGVSRSEQRLFEQKSLRQTQWSRKHKRRRIRKSYQERSLDDKNPLSKTQTTRIESKKSHH